MVATVIVLGAAQSTVGYFEEDGYYAKNDPEHRRASAWHGGGAGALGLRGHVHPKRFEEVLAGYVPHTGIRLGRMRDGEHQHRPGLDITLSAPKSVSLEGLVFGARRVVRAHDEAVRETLDWIEADMLQTRGYDPATGRCPRERAHGMVAALSRMHGLAPSSAAVRALARGAGIETRTLQWFLTRFDDLSDAERLARGREAYAGSVLAIDEASMIGTVQMEALLRIAGKLDVARVVLIGDTRQLRAVDAGQPFRVLQRAGMATTVMDEVLRQRDANLAAAVAHVRDGHPDLALRTLGERVQETARETLGEAAGTIWLALPDAARAETAVLAPTHAMRREIHATIREGLALEGTLHGATLTIERLIGRRLTRADAADIQSYAEGDTVVFHRDAYGCLRDDVCTVARIGDHSVELAHPDGAPPVVEPEVFDKLRADWTAVRTRAETTGDIACFTDGYTDVMSRAAALSAIEDLPADMRRFKAG